MARRSLNWRRIKRHRCYSVLEITRLLGVHENTVRSWIKRGLSVLAGPGPILVQAESLIEHIRSQRRRQPCGPGRIYCVACRVPKVPNGGFASYEPINQTQGNLVGFCPECDRLIYRRVSLRGLQDAAGALDIQFPEPSPRISETD